MTAQLMLSQAPTVHPSAHVTASTLGAWTQLEGGVTLSHCQLGECSYVMEHSQLDYAVIGKCCSLASEVRLNPGQHPLSRPTSHHLTYRSAAYGLGEDDAAFFAGRAAQQVHVGHDVWIGHGVTVMGGVTLGNGAVIGAGAVVTHDVPPYSVAVGVPARVIRARFPAPLAERLERLAWWNWTHEQLRERLSDLRGDALAFVEKYELEKYALERV